MLQLRSANSGGPLLEISAECAQCLVAPPRPKLMILPLLHTTSEHDINNAYETHLFECKAGLDKAHKANPIAQQGDI